MSLTRVAGVFLLAGLACAVYLGGSPQAQTGGPPATVSQMFLQLTFDRPVDIDPIPGTNSAYLVVEQDGRIFKVDTGRPQLKKQVLDITAITTDQNEEGLLGLAFDPNYQSNRKVYLYYTTDPRQGVLARYKFRPVGEFNSARRLLSIPLPENAGNHNGGGLEFGPDGFLYLSVGEGGSTPQQSQDINSRAGKVLRADVSKFRIFPAPGNPFVGVAGDDFVYALGFRNPWRFSFDSLTGVLWLGDVGQQTREEVNTVELGENYGWPCREGFIAGPNSSCDDDPGFQDPEFDYLSNDNSGRCSITGGRVYRGSAIQALFGSYIYGDFCTGEVFYTPADNPDFTEADELADLSQLVSFGVDRNGELLVVTFNTIYRIVPMP